MEEQVSILPVHAHGRGESVLSEAFLESFDALNTLLTSYCFP